MKKHLFWIIPILIVFASPWVHWLVYRNFLLAFPNMSGDLAHAAALMLSILAPLISSYIISTWRS